MTLHHDGQQQQQKEKPTTMTLIASQSQSQSQLHQSSLLFLGTATASSAAVATTTSTPNSLSLMRSPPTTAVTLSPSPSSSVTTMMAMTTCTSTVASASNDNDSSSRSMPIIEGETDNDTRLPLQKVSAVPVRIATVLQKNPIVYRAAATILIGTAVVPLMGAAASVVMFGVHHVLPAAVLLIVGRLRPLLAVTVTGGGKRTTRLLSLARHTKRLMSKIHLQKITKLIYHRVYNNSYCWYDDHIIPSPKQQQR
eukprot:CAMPEP_0170845460 /NCGR_PEP_ID=MMETSP0734-20130129/7587_1 /TAXON_ID=186038 /ORGANISM="Fragilariopsis kerguelensis, Strain L26-C5" /LENGTH=252 /DNA_ID=CAMNT_0011214265 /DNA_START=114 /DNA_END=872 /DNA_ORIENTATION=+